MNSQMKKVGWRTSLQELMRNIAGNGSIYVSEMESDLLQINLLLNEAINKLGINVVEVGQNVTYLQGAVKQLVDKANVSSDSLERVQELNQAVGDNVAAIVTAMQFQDMTCQLLDKVLSRITGLQKMHGEIERLALEVSGAESEGDIQMMVWAAGEEMDEQRRELEGLHAQRVSQKHMESGSIELF